MSFVADLSLGVPTVRFWGWKENSIEVKRDHEELSALAKAGKPLYGESDLPEYVQGVAHRNSMWSQVSRMFGPTSDNHTDLAAPLQLKFGALPW